MHLRLATVALLFPILTTFAAPQERQDLDRLIQQLGSGKFAEREAAQKALESAGPEALERLRSAAASADPEISRRAKELVPLLERRGETNLALSTKRFAFRVKDMPVDQAVRELAKQFGVAVVLTGDTSKLAERKLTLETPELTFWEVLERFNAAAGLTETGPPAVARAEPRQPQFRGGLVEINGLNDANAGNRLQAVHLADGKAEAVPTYLRGALRVRALPAGKDDKPGKGEGLTQLEVRLEPRLGWRGAPRLRIDEAVDDKSQALAHIPAEDNSQNGGVPIMIQRGGGQVIVQRVIVGGGNQLQFESLGGMPAGENLHKVPLRFRLPDEPGSSLKSLKGVLTGELPLPPEDLLIIDNIKDVPKADKKVFAGKDGLQANIKEVTLRDDGSLRIGFELTGDQNLAQGLGVNFQNFPGAGRVNLDAAGLEGTQIRLLDADDKPYRITGSQTSTQVNNGQVSNLRHYTFSPPSPQSTAKKFVVRGSPLAKVEAPFTLSGITLTK